MWLMLNPYRRHSSDCKHKAKGRAYRQCKCPIWVQGTVNGEPVKRALDTRDWAIELCRKHNATLFPRRDSERLYVSAMVGDAWLDFTRISGYDTERKR